MKTPTISILTTVYNREKYLAECIESVQNGHYQDYEHIIVDDGSTDGSVALAQEYAAKDARIRVYQNETNLGDYPNRNQAASYATGKYIKYLDADDMHGRFMVDIMVDAMETFPEAGFGLFDYGPNKPLFPVVLQPAETYAAHYSGKHPVFGRSPINAIMKRDVFKEVGGFSGKQHVGDFELWHILGALIPCPLCLPDQDCGESMKTNRAMTIEQTPLFRSNISCLALKKSLSNRARWMKPNRQAS